MFEICSYLTCNKLIKTIQILDKLEYQTISILLLVSIIDTNNKICCDKP